MSRRRRGAAAGCALGFATGWNIGNLGGIMSELAGAYGVGLATVGLFATALFVTHMGVQIPGGRITDRFGVRRAGALGIAAIAGGDLLALTAAEPAVAIAGRLVTGVGTAISFVAGSEMVRSAGGTAFAQGVYGGVGLGAGGAALALVPQLEPVLGWRAPYGSSLALALAAALALAVATEPAPRGVRRHPGMGGVLRDRRLWPLATLYSASYGLSVVLSNWTDEFLSRRGTLGGDGAELVAGSMLLAGVLTRPLGGWIMHHRPDATRRAVAGSLLAGAVGTVALLAGGPAWLPVLGGALVGVAAGIPFSPSFTGAGRVRADAPAAAVGLVNAAANLAILVGTPVVGLTFSLGGDGRIGLAAIALLWGAALAALPSADALGLARRSRATRSGAAPPTA